MATCIFPGCRNIGIHNFGVRLRRPDTSAVWAPNTDAFICDDHAGQGMRISVTLEPTETGNIETRILATDGLAVSRTTPIINTP